MEEFSENIQKIVFIIVILSVFGFLIRHLFVDVGDNNVTSYLKNNYVKIFSMMTVLLFVIVFFNVLGFKFDTKEKPVLTGKYIVENFNINRQRSSYRNRQRSSYRNRQRSSYRNSNPFDSYSRRISKIHGNSYSGYSSRAPGDISETSQGITDGESNISDKVKEKISEFSDRILNYDKSSDVSDTTSTINNEISNDLLPESFWETKGQGFCNAIIGDSETHKEACKQLSFSNCSAFTSCCAAANGKDEESYSCVPVSTGTGQPIFNNDNLGQNIDFYWYKGKCYGEQCNLSKEDYESYKEKRLQIIKNKENGNDIIDEAVKEQEKAESGCKFKQNSCYLWGIPDANISPFG